VIWGPNDPRPTPPIFIPIEPPPVEGGGPEVTPPIYIPVWPTPPVDPGYGIPEVPVDPGYNPPGVGAPGSGLTPDNPIVLPPIDLPAGQTTIYVSLTPGVPVEVNVPAGSGRRKK
jgi:hypothetical protein